MQIIFVKVANKKIAVFEQSYKKYFVYIKHVFIRTKEYKFVKYLSIRKPWFKVIY